MYVVIEGFGIMAAYCVQSCCTCVPCTVQNETVYNLQYTIRKRFRSAQCTMHCR